jgi:hypothetical protein
VSYSVRKIDLGGLTKGGRSFLESTWLLGAVVAFLSWPSHLLVPSVNIDVAWQLSLQMAAHQQLHFGTQFVLNGGPLEFVLHPMALYAGPAIVGAVYLLFTQLALAITLVWTLRRSLPALFAVPIAYVVATIDTDQFVPAPEPLLAIAFIWCLVAILDDPPSFTWPLLVVGGAIASAIALLVQFSDGFLILAMCVLAILCQRRDRRLGMALFAGIFVTVLSVLWFATGQSVSNADDYVRTAFEILSQWSVALPYNAPVVDWAKTFAAGAIAASFVAAYLGTQGLAPLRRAVVFLIVAMLDFSAWKHGFVIDIGTYTALFAWLMLLPWLAFQWRGWSLGVALVAMATLVVLFYPVSGVDPVGLTRPIARAQDARDQLKTLLLPGPRTRARQEARDYLRDVVYKVDPKTLSLLRGKSVFAYPWETALTWAYGLDWHPQPVLPILAYSPYLDRLDAEAMASPDGPQAILRHRPCGAYLGPPFAGCEAWVAVGPTFMPHEEPRATIAMFCNFEPARTTPKLQVLIRVPDRCGKPRFLFSQNLDDFEESRIPAPGPGEAIFAKVHGLEPRGPERLRTFLYRAAERFERLDGEYTFRVVPGTMEDGVILRVPPRLNFPQPFPVTFNASTIDFETVPGRGVSTGDYRIDYFALPVHRQPQGSTADRRTTIPMNGGR